MFHGIVPGLSCSPIGKILIDVLFGDKDHFRREPVWFEVVDLESPYQALLGRPALAKSSQLAESLVIAAERRLLDRVVAMAGKQPEMSPDPKESEAEGSFKPAKETKRIPLDPEHPERHAVIGANLDSK